MSDIDEEALQASFTEYMAEVSFDYEQFTERLNMLFAVFEDNANIGIVQKVAASLFGKK